MTFRPEPHPAPLRPRLGPRADFWHQSEVTPEIADALADSFEYQGAEADADDVAVEETPRAPELKTEDAPVTALARGAWSEGLDRAVAQTDRRVDLWLADQQRRLVAGPRLMLAQLKEQRKDQAAPLRASKGEE